MKLPTIRTEEVEAIERGASRLHHGLRARIRLVKKPRHIDDLNCKLAIMAHRSIHGRETLGAQGLGYRRAQFRCKVARRDDIARAKQTPIRFELEVVTDDGR